jgi:hypothetical protein
LSAFSIESISTHAEPDASGKLTQWAEIKLLVPKDFDWTKPDQLLKKLQAAAELAGRGE